MRHRASELSMRVYLERNLDGIESDYYKFIDNAFEVDEIGPDDIQFRRCRVVVSRSSQIIGTSSTEVSATRIHDPIVVAVSLGSSRSCRMAPVWAITDTLSPR